MRKKAILKTYLSVVMLGFISISCAGEIKINFRPEIKEVIKAYQKFEISFDLDQVTGNPFSSRDIEVTAIFYSPQRKKINVPGFLYQDYQNNPLENGGISLTPNGKPCWKVRFTPTETGIYRYEVQVKHKLVTYQSRRERLQVIPSSAPGFIRISPEDHRYFEFDCGRPYFAAGHNLCWYSSDKGIYDYDYYFSKMEKASENYTRIWLSPWAFALEWDKLGSYNLASAWQLDYVLNLAESKGIYIMLCIDTFNTLNSTSSYGKWASNPYNKAKGGPCAKPEKFFTDSKAIQYYREKLRYIIARWGYSPNILAWELWNEVDFTDNYSPENIRDWHKEIIPYLHTLDPHRHLITTSYFKELGEPQVWQLPGINFTQSRAYGSHDIALTVHELCCQMNRLYPKPHLVAEFAITHSNQDSAHDPQGDYLHDGIWAATFSLSAGTAMSWWWDSHLDKNNLYYHFKALAEFTRDIEWTRGNYTSLEVKCYETKNPSQATPTKTYGLLNQDGTNMLLWIQKKNNNDDLTAEIVKLKAGKYLVQWWDTYQGMILKSEEIKCTDGTLGMAIPPFRRDIAAKITPLPSFSLIE